MKNIAYKTVDKNGKTISASYTPIVRPDTIFRDKEGNLVHIFRKVTKSDEKV